MAPLPLLKLAGLLVKTIAKPVATRLKVEARKHPTFSRICIKVGELSHQVTSRMNVIASGYKILGVNPLPEEEALSRGVNFLSESFVFTVAGTIIIVEYSRSETKNALKAQKAAEEESRFRQYLDDKFAALSADLHFLRDRVEKLETIVEEQRQAREERRASSNPSETTEEKRQSWLSWMFPR